MTASKTVEPKMSTYRTTSLDIQTQIAVATIREVGNKVESLTREGCHCYIEYSFVCVSTGAISGLVENVLFRRTVAKYGCIVTALDIKTDRKSW